ncbi:hypothetical protein KX928_04910 [Roseobacter sp. YSTF-M11]|uniref:VPLPA-CTERM protein sorting domain-containing protein n=1 Tax=Roseobacter insulae TaxID=2859783 RepID=A0A9X1FSU9_9RHOB|nr:hypothetical protein [Roseobacter insulae]MBW4707121.1 hypothetical protein [Roseobacter insulae]
MKLSTLLLSCSLVFCSPAALGAAIIQGFGIAGTHFWFLIPQATSLDDIGGLDSVALSPNFAVAPGEVIFDNVVLSGPATGFATDGTGSLEVFFATPVAESDLPLQPFVSISVSPALDSKIAVNGAFSFVETGPDGEIRGTTRLAPVPLPAGWALGLSLLGLGAAFSARSRHGKRRTA